MPKGCLRRYIGLMNVHFVTKIKEVVLREAQARNSGRRQSRGWHIGPVTHIRQERIMRTKRGGYLRVLLTRFGGESRKLKAGLML